MRHVLIFSDLDGCLLNKSDYQFQEAIPVLARIKCLEIPLILASSKTEPEMRVIADEMQLADAPMICENGGVVFLSRQNSAPANKIVLGAERSTILNVLRDLRTKFQFESFEDMQLEGVQRSTGLTAERAQAALARSCTEPLVWHDSESKIDEFRKILESNALTLTRGGRFWHVAGQTDKGRAMDYICKLREEDAGVSVTTIAIGDSPIDQSMLNLADYPIAIPSPGGVVQVEVSGENSVTAKIPGAAGWADTVSSLLDALR